jgi:hypothetical protein
MTQPADTGDLFEVDCPNVIPPMSQKEWDETAERMMRSVNSFTDTEGRRWFDPPADEVKGNHE